MSEPSDPNNRSSLPPRPPNPPRDIDDRLSPPHKRPRTRAPPKADIASAKTMDQAAHPTSSASSAKVHSFSIKPVDRFRGNSATIKRPREVAHFSYNDNHEYQDDESGINYYVPPPMGVDLKEGFDTFRHFVPKEDEHIDSLLKAIVNKERREGREKKVKGDFVTWRGMMTKILVAPFDHFAEFSMFATLHDGTIYIEEDFPSAVAEWEAQANQPTRYQPPGQQSQEMMTYWGYKFETLALIPTPPAFTPRDQIEKHQRSVVSNHAQHCSIVSTSFGPHSLIIGGEVDGLLAPKPSDPDTPVQWVELKTSQELPPPHQQKHGDILKFERKLLKFWAQSFLLGVPKIVVGFRSQNGILRSLQTFNTHEIPGMVRRGTGCWDGNVCINFATSFLAWLKETIKDEGVYSLVLKKKSGVVQVKKIKEEGTGSILSEEFLAWRRQGDTKN